MRNIKIFLFFSIFGYIFEELICFILKINFESGILHGPYTPIYGIGLLIIFNGIQFIVNKFHLKYYQELIIAGGLLFFVITILELTGGILIEKIFHKVYWSYENLKFNYGNYISLEISITWTVLSLIIYHFKKFFLKIINRIPNVIYYLIGLIFIIDCIYTFVIIT